jgi:hypothetical protein
MNISDLKKETAWITEIDQDFVLDIQDNVLWAVFSVEEDTKIPVEHQPAVDVYNCDFFNNEDRLWCPLRDANEEMIAKTPVMRYIVKA